jgi:hypothetical protein
VQLGCGIGDWIIRHVSLAMKRRDDNLRFLELQSIRFLVIDVRRRYAVGTFNGDDLLVDEVVRIWYFTYG